MYLSNNQQKYNFNVKQMSLKNLFLFFILIACNNLQAQNKCSYVNPFIGTNGMGHTFPGACVPFGFVQLSPDTDTIPHNIDGKYQPKVYEYCAGYQYKDSSIVGFSHTHFNGTGHSDLGDILIMPITGTLKLNPGIASNPESGYRSRFSHTTEKAYPGYYEVMLDDYQIKAQLTATQRVGIHKYTYPAQAENQCIILDLDHGIYNYDDKVLWASIRVENDTLLTGYRVTNGWARIRPTYFAISFSKPITEYGYKERANAKYQGFYRIFDVYKNFPEIGGRKIVAYFNFDHHSSKELEIKVALSGVSTEGAIKNLHAEATGLNFDQLAEQATGKWEHKLSTLEAQGNTDQLTMLYTSLYHTMINPSIYMDVDGNYRGLDNNIHQADGFDNYTVFSLWDTYRALHPLFNIINRKVNTDIVNSMLKHYEQSVHHILPIWSHMGNENWCMIGYHAVSVLADAIAKGIPMDKELALKAMINSSTIPYLNGIAEYIDKGYVSLETNNNAASLTLEYAYDDWAIYQTAQNCGHSSIAHIYQKRAMNYHNLLNPQLGYIQPRHNNGTWKTPFSLSNTSHEGFIEGNSLNYSFYIPHNVADMINLMGGDKQFIAKLDSLFTINLSQEFFAHTEDITSEGVLGGYVHGNEPGQHIPFLYAWTSEPWKTHYWQYEIMNKMYRNDIQGLCGNDDCGQMSAWYIFSAMGFYPVCPGTNQYVLGAPYLPHLKINLENGKTFEIVAKNISSKNKYVQSVMLNGKLYTKGYITQEDILHGGVLTFQMSSVPNKKRIFSADDKPYSLTKNESNL